MPMWSIALMCAMQAPPEPPASTTAASETHAAPAAAPAPSEPPAAEPPPAKPKLLVLDVKAADLSQEQAGALTDVVATRAARFGQADVIAAADVRQLLDLEASKAESGCDDNGSCLAELAGALNADWVLASRAGKIGNRFVVTMQLYDAKKGSVATRDTVEAYAVDELPGQLGTMVDRVLTTSLGEAVPTTAAPTKADAATKPDTVEASSPVWLPLQIGGGAAAVVGLAASIGGLVPLVMYGQAKADLLNRTRKYDGKESQLEEATEVHRQAIATRDAYNNVGRFAVIGGAVLLVGGGAALAAGFLLPTLNVPSEEGAP
jgi:hypothetical protein